MNACVSTVGILSDRNDLIPWENLFLESQNYLYVGLCDEDLCDMASQLLVKFFQVLILFTIISNSTSKVAARRSFEEYTSPTKINRSNIPSTRTNSTPMSRDLAKLSY